MSKQGKEVDLWMNLWAVEKLLKREKFHFFVIITTKMLRNKNIQIRTRKSSDQDRSLYDLKQNKKNKFWKKFRIFELLGFFSVIYLAYNLNIFGTFTENSEKIQKIEKIIKEEIIEVNKELNQLNKN